MINKKNGQEKKDFPEVIAAPYLPITSTTVIGNFINPVSIGGLSKPTGELQYLDFNFTGGIGNKDPDPEYLNTEELIELARNTGKVIELSPFKIERVINDELNLFTVIECDGDPWNPRDGLVCYNNRLNFPVCRVKIVRNDGDPVIFETKRETKVTYKPETLENFPGTIKRMADNLAAKINKKIVDSIRNNFSGTSKP